MAINTDDDQYGIREIKIEKQKNAFGFNIEGPNADGGSLFKLNGELYPPLNYVSSIKFGGPASVAGLKIHDVLLSINNIDVKGMKMSSVKSIINNTNDSLVMCVMYPNDIKGLKTSIEKSNQNNPDLLEDDYPLDRYLSESEFNILPVSIPIVSFYNCNGKKTAHFNIFGRMNMLTAKRFSEFYAYNKLLNAQLTNLPDFPSRWPLIPNNIQLEERRKELEKFLVAICKNPILLRMTPTRELLGLSDISFSISGPINSIGSKNKQAECPSIENTDYILNVALPNHSSYFYITVNQSDKTTDVYRKLCTQLKINQAYSKYFALYHQNEDKNEIMLKPNEKPFDILIADILRNKRSLISIRKKYIGLLHEEYNLFRNLTTINIIFDQLVQDISVGVLKLSAKDPNHNKEDLSHLAKTKLLNHYQESENYGVLYFKIKQAELPSNLISALPKEVNIESINSDEYPGRISKITGNSLFILIAKNELRISHLNVFREVPLFKISTVDINNFECVDNSNSLTNDLCSALVVSIKESVNTQLKIFANNVDYIYACIKSVTTSNEAKIISY